MCNTYNVSLNVSLIGLLCLCVLFPLPARGVETDQAVEKILISGNDRVQEPTIRYYITLKEGEPYSAAKVRADIKNLYNQGHFDDIRVDAHEGENGLIVSYIVREKPFVLEVTVSGTEEVTKKEVLEHIEIKKGGHFKKNLVLKDITSIKKFYREKGFYFVDVDVDETDRGNNQVEIKYDIDEGSKIYVKNIRFFGNTRFSDRELLSEMETSTQGVFSWLTDSGTYKKDILKGDMLKIENFYHNNGFIKFRIEDPRVEIDREMGSIYIALFIEEGAQYRVGTIQTQGDDLYSAEKIRDTLGLEKGDIFDRSIFAKGIFDITALYLTKGYAFVDVIQRTHINVKEKIVDIELDVDRGQKIYIGKINIRGNEKTRDKVVRREFRLKEGGLFDISKLRRSRERLNRLGFFEKVEIKQKSREEDELLDLDVEVTETNTGTLSVGAGYSSIENAVFFATITQRNLFGRGQKISLNANLSSIKKDYSLDFTEPYLFDRELSAGVSFFNNEVDYISYSATSNGSGVRMGKALGEYSWGRIAYRYKLTNTFLEDSTNASSVLRSALGEWETNEITPSATIDTRDDYFSPTQGSKVSLNGTFAWGNGPETEVKFYRFNYENSYYHPLLWKFIFMGRAKAGYIDSIYKDRLPIFENYRLGGSSSVRGFNFDDIGPRDSNGFTIGGNALLQFNVEIHYPFTQFVRGILFYDRGQVYGQDMVMPERTSPGNFDLDEMRHSWGIGVKFFSPMGPISLAWGFKLDPLTGEDASEFHFNVGGLF